MDSVLIVRRFHSADQHAAKALILRGMEEHWGRLDTTLNRDLDHINASYAHGVFLVALVHGNLIGTGALVPEADGVGRIVRMSVAREMRRRGIGRLLLDRLCHEARECEYHRLVVGTETWWADAVLFYESHGFKTTMRTVDGQQFSLALAHA